MRTVGMVVKTTAQKAENGAGKQENVKPKDKKTANKGKVATPV